MERRRSVQRNLRITPGYLDGPHREKATRSHHPDNSREKAEHEPQNEKEKQP